MAGYLIDTTPLAAYLLGRTKARALITPFISRRQACTSMVVYGEIFEYLRGYIKPPSDFDSYHDQLRNLLTWGVFSYNLSFSVLERYADIRRALRGPGKPGIIGDVDTMIAATALEYDLTLITADSDFQRVAGLTVMMYSVK